MSEKIAIIFSALGIVVLIGTEILRSLVHRRRERIKGIGGTQDIEMFGTFISLALFLIAAIALVLWILHR
jgi:hypothetical protein